MTVVMLGPVQAVSNIDKKQERAELEGRTKQSYKRSTDNEALYF